MLYSILKTSINITLVKGETGTTPIYIIHAREKRITRKKSLRNKKNDPVAAHDNQPSDTPFYEDTFGGR